MCGNPIYRKYRVTCSRACSKKYVRSLYKQVNFKEQKNKIRQEELRVKNLEKKLRKKLKIQVHLPFRKPDDWPRCRKCKTIVYIIRKRFYCDKCDKIVTKVSYKRVKRIWGRDHEGNTYYKCIKCYTNQMKHYGKGMCFDCYHENLKSIYWGRDHRGHKFKFCISCKLATRRHHSNGLCVNCYVKRWKKNHES